MMNTFKRIITTISLEELTKTVLTLNEKVVALESKVTKLESKLEELQEEEYHGTGGAGHEEYCR